MATKTAEQIKAKELAQKEADQKFQEEKTRAEAKIAVLEQEKQGLNQQA